MHFPALKCHNFRRHATNGNENKHPYLIAFCCIKIKHPYFNAFSCIKMSRMIMKTSIHFNACLCIFLHKSIKIFAATRRLIMKTSIHTLFNACLGIFMHENVKIFAATRRMVMKTTIYFNSFLCISCLKMSKFSLLRGEW